MDPYSLVKTLHVIGATICSGPALASPSSC